MRLIVRGVRVGGRLPVTHAGHAAQDDFYSIAERLSQPVTVHSNTVQVSEKGPPWKDSTNWT